MAINHHNHAPFNQNVSVMFSQKDRNKISRMRGTVTLISTVCPDYPHDGKKYTFQGELGSGISLTARLHLFQGAKLMDELKYMNLDVSWIILVADLPELTEYQAEFYQRVAGNKRNYIARCRESARKIQAELSGKASALTFSDFYGKMDYVGLQESVAERILATSHQEPIKSRLAQFMLERASLASNFRGRALSRDELKLAAAHGMSLYITHGTLLRSRFAAKHLVVINHETPNLSNFYLARFVPGFEHWENTEKFPLGILPSNLY